MSENRKQILQMLSEGRINAEEAERLIAALDSPTIAGARTGAGPSPKYLRVLIEADDEADGESMTKVNIRVPLQLLRAGVKLASLIPAEARGHVNEALREKGVDFDINQFKPENLDELIENLQDVSIDIDKKNRKAKIKIFCE